MGSQKFACARSPKRIAQVELNVFDTKLHLGRLAVQNSGQKKLYGFLRHLAHCEFYLLKLIMSSHPSGIIPNHGLRVRHRRIHTAENSQNVMSKWLSQQFLNIKPFF